MNEIWKDIQGYDGAYQVSNLGRIRSKGFKYLQRSKKGAVFERYTTPKILSQSYTVEGYLVVSLTKDGITKQYKVHRILAEAFIKNPDGKSTINHINGIKDDNRLENLEWCTSGENTRHAHATGLCKRPKNAKCVARLSEEGDVVEVFRSALEAARAYNHYNCSSNLTKICRNGKGRWYEMKWKYISLSEYNDFKENHRSH